MSSMHQLAYLTPRRTVAWKCLSLEAQEQDSRIAPVAYASRSGSLFPGMEGKRSPGVLWVVSAPTYRRRASPGIDFPPTLTAKLVVDRVVTGDAVRSWAPARDCELDAPCDDEAFQEWRGARSVADATERAIFRITRDFAILSWKGLRKLGRNQGEAWASVRTAVADARHSRFFAHVDAESCLRKAIAIPAAAKIGIRLQSPRQLHGDECIAELEELARIGTEQAIFMSYRWNERSADVASLARELLALRCGVWLDGLAIPHFAANPMVWSGRGWLRKDPPRVDLERLLHAGIAHSGVFLCLAAGDFEELPRGAPQGSKNWAMQEYEYATRQEAKLGTPRVRVVDLGGAPEQLKNENPGRVLQFHLGEKDLARTIAELARPSQWA